MIRLTGVSCCNDHCHLPAAQRGRTLSKTRKMFGALNEKEIESLIHREFIGRIGCHAEGITYVVPISYAYDGEYIYGHTYEGMKLNIMRKNPKICFEVDDLNNLANWQSAIAFGEFEELEKGKERDHAVHVLMDRTLPLVHSETMHLSPQWPFPLNDAAEVNGIIFRIRLTQKTGRYEKNSPEYIFAT
jgi:nitroimidazol reductase NimA-like FMN-containing flavoprotein (pyridoxamine 5'-phosphate oxidase superfamily)